MLIRLGVLIRLAGRCVLRFRCIFLGAQNQTHRLVRILELRWEWWFCFTLSVTFRCVAACAMTGVAVDQRTCSYATYNRLLGPFFLGEMAATLGREAIRAM
jgi:hypothetical protein